MSRRSVHKSCSLASVLSYEEFLIARTNSGIMHLITGPQSMNLVEEFHKTRQYAKLRRNFLLDAFAGFFLMPVLGVRKGFLCTELENQCRLAG